MFKVNKLKDTHCTSVLRGSMHMNGGNLDIVDHDNNILDIYRVSQEECAILLESVPYVELYRYNPKHLCPKLNVYGDNGQRSLKL